MAAPTFVQSISTAFNSATDPKTTSSFSVLTGDVIVGLAGSENDLSTLGLMSGGSLTWTNRQSVDPNSGGANSCCRIDTTVATSGASITASETDGGSSVNWFGANFLQFRGSDGIGASANADTTGAPSIAITTTQANSAVAVIVVDFAGVNGSARTWRTVNGTTPSSGNGLETTYLFDAAHYTVYVGYYPDVGAAGSKTVGLSLPTGQDYTAAAVEILGTASGAMTGAVGLSLGVSGALTGAGRLLGAVGATFTPTGALSGAGALAGNVPMSLGASGALLGAGRLIGAVPVSVAVTGAMTGAGRLLGAVPITITPSAALTGAGAMAGAISSTFGVSGSFALNGSIAGSIPMTLTPAGALTGAGRLIGAIPNQLAVTGVLAAAGALPGAIQVTLSAGATLTGAGRLASTLPITVGASGALSGGGAGSLSGVSSITFAVSGLLTGVGFTTPTPRRRRIVIERERRVAVVGKAKRAAIVPRSRRVIQ